MDAHAANGPFGDTAEDVAEVQRSRWREMDAAEKAALVQALTRTTHELAAAGIAVRYPDAAPRERFLRLAVLRLGRALAEEAYPEVRALAP